ncbi:Zinc finger, FYVE/PHD-type [Quillaja saponaria]|uniref:Zinc finger, FYVE/PHD-type n=1 Tax=Quillaja saponaria TaxID=32244 RepID=A0AAD7LFG0_QUISA|nr:Zinc finger, FYVE/PHD-type [Quillaja saponaria]
MIICQICGDKGDLKRLIICIQCQISAQHSYCLDELHKDEYGRISWKCEECAEATNPSALPSRKSDRITQAVEVKVKRMILRKLSTPVKKTKHSGLRTFHEHAHMDKSPEEKFFDFLQMDDTGTLPSCNEILSNQELISEKNRTVEENFSSDETKPVERESSELAIVLSDIPLNKSGGQPLLENDKGKLIINHGPPFGIVAHLSSKACSKVHDAISAFQQVLNVEMLSRPDVWPKSFQMSPPIDDSIALYFFPEYERDEKVYDRVVSDIIELDLALKADLDCVELLIISSCELPPEHWRICRKYYLWGVFRQKRPPWNGNSDSITPPKLTNVISIKEDRRISMGSSSFCPNSPLQK